MSQGKEVPAGLAGEWNEDMIAAHNARVRAFWKKVLPLVDGMTDEQCREAAKAGLEEGLAMNRLADRMRGVLGGDWEDGHVGVGIAIYRKALERLDLYDADFRPRPERQLMESRDGYEVYYLTAEREFEVVADGRSERFRASFRPVFGMDVDDASRAARIAKALTAAARPGNP